MHFPSMFSQKEEQYLCLYCTDVDNQKQNRKVRCSGCSVPTLDVYMAELPEAVIRQPLHTVILYQRPCLCHTLSVAAAFAQAR